MKNIFLSIVIAFGFAVTANAANPLESYLTALSLPMPVDAVYLAENRIVVGDRSYSFADSLVVHAPGTSNASRARLLPGVVIGFTRDNNGLIKEIWLLPNGYKLGTDYRY